MTLTDQIPSTPEGMALAYGSLLVMALIPIFVGAFRSVKSHKEQVGILKAVSRCDKLRIYLVKNIDPCLLMTWRPCLSAWKLCVNWWEARDDDSEGRRHVPHHRLLRPLRTLRLLSSILKGTRQPPTISVLPCPRWGKKQQLQSRKGLQFRGSMKTSVQRR